MFLRSLKVYCRLCGARKSLHLNRNPEVLGGFSRCQFAKNDGFAQTQERSFSEKSRDPKNFRWVTGRPDDPPKKNRPKMTGRPDSTCVTKEKPNQDQKPVSNIKASDVSNPEKWTGRPDSTCAINQKHPDPPTSKTERTKESDHSKPKKGPKGGKASFSGPAKDITKTSSSGMSALQVGSIKRPAPPEVTSAMLEEVRSLNQRQPPCLEGSKIAKEEDIEPSSASVFATQFNVAHQGMPELVSGYARSMKFSEEQNTVKRPETIRKPISELDKFPKLSEMIHASKTQTSPPPSEIAAKTNTEGNSSKFHAIPEVKLSGSSLKNHLLGMQKEQKLVDSPEKSGRGKRIDIKISKLPPLKIVRETYNEENRHRVYSFGLAETGALGFHKPNEGKRWRKYMARPLRHQFAEENRVISAESGYGFTLFYVLGDSPIKLYGCGINTDFQLGPTDDEVVTYPSPIDLRISSPKTKIVSFSAGRAHSVVATDKEGVFLFGSNTYGQCGRIVEEEESSNGCTITQIKGFGGEKVVTVACGQDHTCFVTESGKVYACGWGSEGQTGQGHCMHVAEPCLVTGEIGSEKIVKIAGKCDTVLALSDKGNLFGWGSNEFKQLRDDADIAQVDSPVALEQVHRKCGKIIDIAAGSSFCLVLNQEGEVYVWGYGILGAGPELVKTSVPTLLPRTLFGANDYHPLTVPKNVYCGVDHMAVVNNLKHVYAWGKNKHGCLGIGNSRDQYFPYKLAISADAIHVSCAVDHSVVVTDHE